MLKGSVPAQLYPMGRVWAAMPDGKSKSLSQPTVGTAFSFTHYPAAHPANALEEHSIIRVTFAPLLTQWRQNISLRVELKLPWSPTSDLNNFQSGLCIRCKSHPKMLIFGPCCACALQKQNSCNTCAPAVPGKPRGTYQFPSIGKALFS